MADISPELRNKLIERFPGHAWALTIPELADLLIRATNEEWSPELFESHLRNSTWWRTTSERSRQFTHLEQTDPAQAAAQVNATKQVIAQLAAQLGGSFDDDTLGAIAWQYHRLGWTDQTLRQQVAAMIRPGAGQLVDVSAIAGAYLVDVTDDEAADYTRRLFTGELTEETLRGIFQQRAMSKFANVPELVNLLRQGATPRDFFADHIAMISRYTDTPASQIDLVRDPTWSQILSYHDPSSGQIRPMTYREAMRFVRGTDQFAQSRAGREETATFIDAVTTALGTRR